MSQETIIDVLIVIDADTIIERFPPGTAESPTSVSDELIWLVVKQGDAIFGEASKDLSLKAQTLDTIRWRETTLSLNAAYSAVIYEFFAQKGGDLISKPIPLLVDVTTPLPDPSDPTKRTSQTIKSYFWSTVVERPGEVTYAFHFMIVDRDGTVAGYYWWDPFIRITD